MHVKQVTQVWSFSSS